MAQLAQRHVGALTLRASIIHRRVPEAAMVDFDDVKQDLLEALVGCAQRFDPDRSASQGSLLTLMYNGPYRSVESEAWRSFGVRPSEQAMQLARRLQSANRAHYARHHRVLTYDEASELLGIPVAATQHDEITVADIYRIRDLTTDIKNYGSLNELDSNSDDTPKSEVHTQMQLQRTMAHSEQETPEEIAVRQDTAQRVRSFIDKLAVFDEREADIICLRFGIGRQRALTVPEVCQELGLYPHQAARLEHRAKSRLTYWLEQADLQPE